LPGVFKSIMRHTMSQDDAGQWIVISGSDFFSVPGIRAHRYQEKNLFFATGEYRFRILRPVTVLAFTTVGRVSAKFNELFDSPVAFGGGGGILIHLSSSRSPRIRFEVGVVNSEVTIKSYGGG